MRMKTLSASLLISALLLIFGSCSFAHTHRDSLIRWKEYTPEAFRVASRENKPILMLITAVWCHWCHVFEEKVLETEDVSEQINGDFIAVFVDYDRRKDLVRKYPSYGLPSIIILAPDGQLLLLLPGYMNKKNFTRRLNEFMKHRWANYKSVGSVEEPPATEVKQPTVEELKRFRARFRRVLGAAYDRDYGGFGADFKEPFGRTLLYALDLYGETGDEELKNMVLHTLDRIAGLKKEKTTARRPPADYLLSLYQGKQQEGWLEKVERLQRRHKIVGLFDPVGKGFFRLAILRDWGIPHYEKLLGVNAEMVIVYLHAYRLTGRHEYKQIAQDTLDYVLGELYETGSGRFFGSQSADEVYYHLTGEERAQVEPPAVDTTSYAVSTAQMVEALLYAHKILGEERYRETARRGLRFLEKKLMGMRGAMSYYDPDERRARIDGQLMDNAWVARAFIGAAGALNDKKFTRIALGLIDFSLEELYDSKGGGFFERNSTSRQFYKEGDAVSREKPFDANGLMALNLLHAYRLTGKEVYLIRARETLGVFVDGDIEASAPFLLRAAGELIPLLSQTRK